MPADPTRKLTVQHLVIFVFHSAVDELLPSDAVIGKTACDCGKTLSLCSVSVIILSNTIQATYVKSSALDEPIGGPLQCRPVARLQDSLHILPQANLGNNWILYGPSVAELESTCLLLTPMSSSPWNFAYFSSSFLFLSCKVSCIRSSSCLLIGAFSA